MQPSTLRQPGFKIWIAALGVVGMVPALLMLPVVLLTMAAERIVGAVWKGYER
jgi:hypothetical protein